MSAAKIVRRARGLGIDLHIDAGQLRFKAPGGLPDDLKGELRQRKDAIINLLSGAPGGAIEAARPAVPSWCDSRCEHHHEMKIPLLGTILWCCWEDEKTGTINWRRYRIDAMNSCPMEATK